MSNPISTSQAIDKTTEGNTFKDEPGLKHQAADEVERTGPPRKNGFVLGVACYLGLPLALFFCTWFRPWIGWPLAIVTLWGCSRCATLKILQRPALKRTDWLFVIGMSLFWTWLCGVGGYLPQSWDYMKHNLLFHDLVTQPWPIYYPMANGEQSYLCYGLGYYLVPTFGAKLLGKAWLNPLIFTWTALGVFLFFYWVATLNNRPKSSIVGMILIASMEGAWITFQNSDPMNILLWDFQFYMVELGLATALYDFFSRFFFAPQHTLTACLGMAVLYELVWRQKSARGAVFLWVMTVFWSPLTSIGLLILPLISLFLKRVRFWNWLEPINLINGSMVLAGIIFYFHGHAPVMERGFIWEFSPDATWVFFLMVFIVYNFLPLFILCWLEYKHCVLGELRPLFFALFGLLLLLLFYKYGFYADSRMLIATSCYILITLCIFQCLKHHQRLKHDWAYRLFLLCLLISCYLPLSIISNNLLRGDRERTYADIVRRSTLPGQQAWTDLSKMNDPLFNISRQYLGNSQHFTARWLLKKPALKLPPLKNPVLKLPKTPWFRKTPFPYRSIKWKSEERFFLTHHFSGWAPPPHFS